ncbi:hypothetical protein L1987_35017 [Smallanthus sonchifolius]|uniref:Uncharacterized protein n=1 Tax=Smallanthus sonchifolius TaxID=185202 RepID=A0ACB9HUQ6_9ASTR|nr:hypothetical protein L1987_35017 [Smallanthus sonchifolius]
MFFSPRQNLRKDYIALCGEVKTINVGYFLRFEILTALWILGKIFDYAFNLVLFLFDNFVCVHVVAIRCRPLNRDEIAKRSTSVVEFDSAQENELKIIGSDSSKNQFKFDHIFGHEDNQGADTILVDFDWKERALHPLRARLHFPTSKLKTSKPKTVKKEKLMQQ